MCEECTEWSASLWNSEKSYIIKQNGRVKPLPVYARWSILLLLVAVCTFHLNSAHDRCLTERLNRFTPGILQWRLIPLLHNVVTKHIIDGTWLCPADMCATFHKFSAPIWNQMEIASVTCYSFTEDPLGAYSETNICLAAKWPHLVKCAWGGSKRIIAAGSRHRSGGVGKPLCCSGIMYYLSILLLMILVDVSLLIRHLIFQHHQSSGMQLKKNL